MKTFSAFAPAFFWVSVLLTGCSHLPGKPGPGIEVPDPADNLDFAALYQQNCAGCHGVNGQHGAAINLADPEYQALVDGATLRRTIAQGVPGTLMPAFAQSSGGMLTDAQVDAIVQGMRTHWARPAQFAGTVLPPYQANAPGDAARGGQVYAADCASCHGAPGKAGEITDPSYLGLIGNQGLRTLVIVGRSDLGAPDWRGNVPGHPMSGQEIDDVVAWLASLRPAWAQAAQQAPVPTQAAPGTPQTQMTPARAGAPGGPQ